MHIPGESQAYRAARDELLEAEAALRAQAESVAALRRKLPEGPAPAEYEFHDEDGAAVTLADLAGDKASQALTTLSDDSPQ